MSAPIPPDNHDWKAEYLRQVDLHNQTLDELREAEMQLRNPAPTPPEQTGDALVEGMYQKMWKDFVSLQRGDAKQICVEAELYRKSLTAPIPPTPTPIQQEALSEAMRILYKAYRGEAWSMDYQKLLTTQRG